MRFGYGGPRKYRHGRYFPGGRRNNGNVSEIERLIHLIASMQILFGGRRGGLGAVVPLLLIVLGAGGFFAYQYFNSPYRALEKAHAMWDSNNTNKQLQAIDAYAELLRKSDTLEPGTKWLKDDRDTLYRRIISHEILIANNERKAAEWVLSAWDEGIRDLRAQDDKVKSFWQKAIKGLKKKSKNKSRNEIPPKSLPTQNKFGIIPGLDTSDSPLPSPSTPT